MFIISKELKKGNCKYLWKYVLVHKNRKPVFSIWLYCKRESEKTEKYELSMDSLYFLLDIFDLTDKNQKNVKEKEHRFMKSQKKILFNQYKKRKSIIPHFDDFSKRNNNLEKDGFLHRSLVYEITGFKPSY